MTEAADSAARIEQHVIRPLLRWYARSHRAMPWRAEPGERADAYHVLVSETMLQQTQVATVEAYFERFVAALPGIEALAEADEQQVLRLWQGLGYYRRARHLHAAATRIVSDHAGRMPECAATLRRLPGVGPYTAGAIASIAFAEPAPVVDGNVARVLARLLSIEAPADTTAGRKRLWHEAQWLVERARQAGVTRHRRRMHAGDWNQALMELGATVCRPRQPQCDACPVRSGCAAAAEGRTAELPVVSKRAAQRPVTAHVLAIERRGRLLWQQRGDAGLWAAMWQMPTLETAAAADASAPSALPAEAVEMAKQLGLQVSPPQHVGSFEHLTTHRRIRFVLWHAPCTSGRLRRGAGQWRSPTHLDDLPLPRPQQRALAMLREFATSRDRQGAVSSPHQPLPTVTHGAPLD